MKFMKVKRSENLDAKEVGKNVDFENVLLFNQRFVEEKLKQ